jgi:glutamate racemase
VLEITKNNLKYLKGLGIKALVIACNTATSAAAETLRKENPDLTIIGIEPAIKPATLIGGRPKILVMATPLTLKEKKYLELAERFKSEADIFSLPCPSLAYLIENGDIDSDEIDQYVKTLLEPYKSEKIDAIVLGCTHYPHVRHIIERHAPKGTRIFDGGEGTARYTRHRLEEKGLLCQSNKKGQVEITNSYKDRKMIEISEKLLYK